MEKRKLVQVTKNGGLLVEVKHWSHSIDSKNKPQENAHIHSCCEIYFNIAGDVSFAVEDKVYSVDTGDLIITKENEIHYCIYRSDCIHEHYCFWIYADETYKEYLSPFYDRGIGVNNKLSLNDMEKEQLRTWLDGIITENKNNRTESIQCITLVFNVLNLLNQCKHNTVPPQGFSSLFSDILNYIDLHYETECTVNDICNAFFISRSSLGRLFVSNLHTTPSVYIENKRFSKAKTMLKSGKSVQETYEQCGFSDYSHFIARFKKKFGVTPYRFSKSDIYN